MDDADSRSTLTDEDKRREKVFDDVIKLISESMEISPTEITSDLNLNTDLPFDSLQLYEMVITLEEAYDIRISDEDLDNVRSIDDIVDLIVRLT
ncbi:MAG: acyl carrier protein [Saccharofermentans sp.]|nr:acyl carrier protein [Saccharofermentans sp.]